MNELDIEVVKEKYIQYKTKHYENEREMRKLLEIKEMVPSIIDDYEWKQNYEMHNTLLSDGLYYYNELKRMLSEEELKKFVEKVKVDVMKERYVTVCIDNEEKIFETVTEEEVSKLEQLEKIQDQYDTLQFLEKFTTKLEEKISNMSKIEGEYERLSEDTEGEER